VLVDAAAADMVVMVAQVTTCVEAEVEAEVEVGEAGGGAARTSDVLKWELRTIGAAAEDEAVVLEEEDEDEVPPREEANKSMVGCGAAAEPWPSISSNEGMLKPFRFLLPPCPWSPPPSS
jgi:hypothetical protein